MEDKFLKLLFSRSNKLYFVLSLMIIFIGYIQYQSDSVWPLVFQGVCLGVILNSWLFSRLQMALIKNEIPTTNKEEDTMSFTFSGEKAVRFKMTAEHFRTLLSGNMVNITNTNSGDRVEFFMEDMGVDIMSKIFNEEITKLYDNLQFNGGIKITPLDQEEDKS